MKPWKNIFVACILLGLLTGCSVKQDLVAPSPSNRDPIIPPPANQKLITLLPYATTASTHVASDQGETPKEKISVEEATAAEVTVENNVSLKSISTLSVL